MAKSLYIYGAGGLGREVKAMLRHLPAWSLAGFYDDSFEKGSVIDGIVCKGGMKELLRTKTTIQLILAFGDPSIKIRIARKLKSNAFIKFPVLIHPTASLLDASTIEVGPGCVITAGAALTTNIIVGGHTLINLNVTIGHDTTIGEACSIMPGANLAGEVQLGEGVLIGSGANLLNKVKIGPGAKIGAGAVVLKNVRHGTVVVGVPAREVDGK